MKQCLVQASEMLTGLPFPQDQYGQQYLLTNRLRERQIVKDCGHTIVTEAGFVTMAVFPDYARVFDDVLVVPGVDNIGQKGFLVVRPDAAPFHSLQCDSLAALQEAQQSIQKSNQLLDYFGSKSIMLLEVAKAPFWLLSTFEDFESSGLCLWGAESFLRRIGLLSVAKRFGLPRIILILAGPYGTRLTAASLLRRKKRLLLKTKSI